MMPVSHKVETAPASIGPPPGAARRSPNSGLLAITVATSVALGAALLGFLQDGPLPTQPDRPATLGLRGSLPISVSIPIPIPAEGANAPSMVAAPALVRS